MRKLTGQFFGLLLASVLLVPDEGLAQEGTPDHPLLVVAAASLDRLMDRAVDVLQANGKPASRDDLITLIKRTGVVEGLDNPDQAHLWYDTTKPVGLMFFFGGDPETADSPADDTQSDDQCGDNDPPIDPSQDVTETFFESLAPDMFSALNLSHKRIVVFLPVKDFRQFLTLGNLTPVSGKANCYRNDKGVEQYLRRMGDYVVGAESNDAIEHCPEPRGIVKPLLGKNDLVVSIQLKGLPPLWRTIGAAGIKSVYDAALQRRDNEPERDYKLRRALGDISRELLDVAVQHIDEINLGLRLEPQVRKFIVDFELGGPKDGKLSKLAAELTPKRSAFDAVWNPDSQISLALSLALPQRHTKPVVTAIRNYVATATDQNEKDNLNLYAPLIAAGCRILESRQFDFVITGDGTGKDESTLIGLKIPTHAELPDQLQNFLKVVSDGFGENQPELAVAEIGGLPVHRIPIEAPIGLFATELLGDGNVEVNAEESGRTLLSASPDSIWLCWTKSKDVTVPEILRKAVELKSSNQAAETRSSFRMMIHTRHFGNGKAPAVADFDAEGDADLEKLRLIEQERVIRQQAARQKLYDEKPDGIAVELTPTSNGWRLSAQFDEVYIALVAQMLEEMQSTVAVPVP